ncbi:hypothetical protein SB748_24280 [Rhizobium sp. SIMBA_035]
MKNRTIGVWLSALAIPVVILVGAQVDTTSGPSIGGGGYDLGPFRYSWLLFIVTVVWSLCACAAAFLYRDRASTRQALGVTAIGTITVGMVLLFYWGEPLLDFKGSGGASNFAGSSPICANHRKAVHVPAIGGRSPAAAARRDELRS